MVPNFVFHIHGQCLPPQFEADYSDLGHIFRSIGGNKHSSECGTSPESSPETSSESLIELLLKPEYKPSNQELLKIFGENSILRRTSEENDEYAWRNDYEQVFREIVMQVKKVLSKSRTGLAKMHPRSARASGGVPIKWMRVVCAMHVMQDSSGTSPADDMTYESLFKVTNTRHSREPWETKYRGQKPTWWREYAIKFIRIFDASTRGSRDYGAFASVVMKWEKELLPQIKALSELENAQECKAHVALYEKFLEKHEEKKRNLKRMRVEEIQESPTKRRFVLHLSGADTCDLVIIRDDRILMTVNV